MGNDFVKIQGGGTPPNFTQGVGSNTFNSLLSDFVQ